MQGLIGTPWEESSRELLTPTASGSVRCRGGGGRMLAHHGVLSSFFFLFHNPTLPVPAQLRPIAFDFPQTDTTDEMEAGPSQASGPILCSAL